MKKLLMLYNPVSGDGRIRNSLSDLVDQATKEGYLVTVYPTQYSGDAKKTIEREGKNFSRIVVCGGDGMMHEAINGWINGSEMPLLGYIPTGTVNDFASTHEIPRDIREAAEVAFGNDWTTMDVGCFNGEYFSYVAAFGVGTKVSYQTPQSKKQKLGLLAYLLEALNTVDFAHWENNCETMKIDWKGGECTGDFLYGMVSNSKYIAGTDFFTRDLFNWHDGLLEGLFIRRPMNLTELNTIIAGISRSDFSNPLFVQVQSPWFEFTSHRTAWTLDGEFGGIHDRVKAEAVPSALKIALPGSHIRMERENQPLYPRMMETGRPAALGESVYPAYNPLSSEAENRFYSLEKKQSNLNNPEACQEDNQKPEEQIRSKPDRNSVPQSKLAGESEADRQSENTLDAADKEQIGDIVLESDWQIRLPLPDEAAILALSDNPDRPVMGQEEFLWKVPCSQSRS